MDETSRGYPYPECEPPLVKDVSDLPAQLKALAEAIDTDLTSLDNERLLTSRPPAARMLESPAMPWAVPSVDITYNTMEFDNTFGDMADTAAGGIRITSTGWYYLGTYSVVIIAAGTEINARTLFLRNGTPLTPAGEPARLVTATAEDPYLSTTVLLNEGDLIRTRIQHSGPGATAYTTNSRLWAFRILAA